MVADLESLADAERQHIGSIWAERARSELGAGSGFAQVLASLYRIGAHPTVIGLAAKAGGEEIQHALRCKELAELYLGKPVNMPTPKEVGMPPHVGATDTLRATLHVIGLCCLNETIAVDFVACQLDASEAEDVRLASSAHLRDEIGHARVGWAHLGSDCLDRKDRQQVSRWLARLVKANGQHWLRQVHKLPEGGFPGHGYAPRKDFAASVRKSLLDVVVPGFQEAGLDATGAHREALAL